MELARKFSILFLVFLCYESINALDKYLNEYAATPFEDVAYNSTRLLDRAKCILSDDACIEPEDSYDKENFPEAMTTYCEECTEQQVRRYVKYMLWYALNEPQIYLEGMNQFRDKASRRMVLQRIWKNKSKKQK